MEAPDRTPARQDARRARFADPGISTGPDAGDVHTVAPSDTMFRQAGAPCAKALPSVMQPAVN